SARWYGWVQFETEHPQRFLLKGQGEAKLIVNGEKLFDWRPILNELKSEYIELPGSEHLELELYYRSFRVGTGISLSYLDDQGGFTVLPPEMLFKPSNSTYFRSLEDQVDLMVESVDWTGKTSEPNSKTAFTDTTPPIIDMSDIGDWYGDPEIQVSVLVHDGPPPSNSGVDPDSFLYRTYRIGHDWSEWTSLGVNIIPIENGTIEFQALVDLKLEGDWEGHIQFKVYDMIGNEAFTDPHFMGVDTKPPAFEIAGAVSGATLKPSESNISVLITDIGGSGVDQDTISVRSRPVEADWLQWSSADIQLIEGKFLAYRLFDDFEGLMEVQFGASDIVGNSGLSPVLTYNIRKPPQNTPPIPFINTPSNGSQIFFSTPVILDALGTKDDGLGSYGEIKLSWFSNIDGYLGQGNMLEVRLSKGKHEITLFADDGDMGHNISTSVTIFIISYSVPDDDDADEEPLHNERESIPWIEIILVIIAVLVLSGVAVALIVYRKRTPVEQVSLGITGEGSEE
ncbi:MAG: hypothetical protein ACMUHB_04705, partial [Thermoplasmatota archaeon]